MVLTQLFWLSIFLMKMSERPEIVSGFQKEGIKTRRGISI